MGGVRVAHGREDFGGKNRWTARLRRGEDNIKKDLHET
jgi:uncharacterized protein HemY